jgi:hypothetical protein
VTNASINLEAPFSFLEQIRTCGQGDAWICIDRASC